MRRLVVGGLIGCVLVASGCGRPMSRVRETPEGYQLPQGTHLTLMLHTPLSSNANQRGDEVLTMLKRPLTFEDQPIVSAGTRVKGLVKRVERFRTLGDRASLLLVFDQMVLRDGTLVPIVASLDTNQGPEAIKVEGKAMKDTRIMSHSALAGTLIGEAVITGHGAEKGLAIGAGLGSSAVFLSEAKEVKLTEGTELIVKLDEPVLIPKGGDL